MIYDDIVPDDDDTKRRAVRLYTETDMSATAIAEEVGTSRATLYNWLNAAGVAGKRNENRRPDEQILRERATEAFTAMQAKVAENTDLVAALATQVAALNATTNRLVGLIEALLTLRPPND